MASQATLRGDIDGARHFNSEIYTAKSMETLLNHLAVEALEERVNAHLATPDISVHQHMRSRQLELARSLLGRRSIYLDIKFWIGLRDAEGASDTSHPYRGLLNRLRQAVADGRAFCPISDSCFLEIYKQSDPRTRRQTIELVDELSLGVALTPLDTRIGTEIAHLVHSARAPETVISLDLLAWTKLTFALGYYSPKFEMADVSFGLAMEKAFFDYMWDVSLAEVDRCTAGSQPPDSSGRHKNLAQRLNEGCQAHASDVKSFKQVYEHELVGVLDLYKDRAMDILADMASQPFGHLPPRDSDAYRALEQQCLAWMINAMTTADAKQTLRTLHINTCIHAALRWNKRQRFKVNDFFDYQHAAAGVGYCDAFFTERSLCSVLTRRDIGLDTLYDCTVLAAPEEAEQYVSSLKHRL